MIDPNYIAPLNLLQKITQRFGLLLIQIIDTNYCKKIGSKPPTIFCTILFGPFRQFKKYWLETFRGKKKVVL